MLWYNPTTRRMEYAPTPLLDAQAEQMLSGHSNSEEFVEEYRRRRATSGIQTSLVITGQKFLTRDRERQKPPRL